MPKILCKYDALVSPNSLMPFDKNRQGHSPEQIERLSELIEFYGMRSPVVVATTPIQCIAKGHGTVDAFKLKGWGEVPVVYQEFDSYDALYGYVQSDNGIGAWHGLDLSAIHKDLPDIQLPSIDLLGIKDFEFEPDPNESDADAVPEVPKEAKTKRGELWLLGDHRLLIDDCTVKENVERLMGGEKADMVFTDPPYGIGLDRAEPKANGTLADGRDRRQHAFAPIHGDDQPYNAQPILELFAGCKEIFLWGANNYAHSVPISSWIVWDRKGTESGDKSLASDFELCWSKQSHKYAMVRIVWHGPFGHNKKDDGDQRVHPSQKPMRLAEWFFDRWGKDTKNIWDGYLGSGSTLIACEKTNRRCFGMEIEPLYGDVILTRFAKYSGKDPIREDGVKWSELNQT